MPKNPVTDVAHTVYTDHSIPRRAAADPRQSASSRGVLRLFGSGTASDRDLGLAYALVAGKERNPVYERRAFELLKTAVGQHPNDIPAVVQLAHLYGYRAQEEQAFSLYEKAVDADPEQVVAANNLATYLMQRGRIPEAIDVWSGVLARSPGFEAARINLAVAQLRAGDSKSAEQTLMEGLQLNPGSKAIRKQLSHWRAASP